MPPRSTKVVLDIEIGKILPPTTPVTVGAVLQGAGGGAGGGTKGQQQLAAVTRGIAGLNRVLASIAGAQFGGNILQALTVSVTALPERLKMVLLALLAVTAASLAFMAIQAAILAILWRVYKALFSVVKGFVALNVAIVRFLALPVRWAIGQTVEALRMYVDAVAQAARATVRFAVQYLRQAVAGFAEFEQNTTNAVTAMGVFGKASIPVRQHLKAMALEISMGSRMAANDVGDLMYKLASGGVEGEKALKAVAKSAVALWHATAGRADVEMLSNTLVTVARQFQLSLEDSARIANLFAAVAQRTPFEIKDIATAMEYAGSSASLFGLSIERTAALLGALAQMGQRASVAGTGLSNVFNFLASRTDKAVAVLARYGIAFDQLDLSKHTIYDVIGVFEKLKNKVGEAEFANILYEAGSVRMARTMASLVRYGSENLRNLEKSFTGTNFAFDAQRDQMNTLAGAWERILRLWEGGQLIIMESLNKPLRGSIKVLEGMIDAVWKAKVFEKLGGWLAKGAEGLLKWTGPLGKAAMKAFSSLLKPETPIEIPGFGDIATNLQQTLVAFIDSLPGMIHDAIRRLAPVAVQLIGAIIPLLTSWIQVVTPLLVQLFAQLGTSLAGFLSTYGPDIIKWFAMFLGWLNKIAAQGPAVGKTVGELLRTYLKHLPVLMDTLLENLPKIAGWLEKLPGFLDRFLTEYVPILQKWIGDLAGVGDELFNHLADEAVSLFEEKIAPAIQEMGKAILGGVTEAMNTLSAALDVFRREGLPLLSEAISLIEKMIKYFPTFVLGVLDLFQKIVEMVMFIFPWHKGIREAGAEVKNAIVRLRETILKIQNEMENHAEWDRQHPSTPGPEPKRPDGEFKSRPKPGEGDMGGSGIKPGGGGGGQWREPQPPGTEGASYNGGGGGTVVFNCPDFDTLKTTVATYFSQETQKRQYATRLGAAYTV